MEIRTSRGRFTVIDHGREAHARGASPLVLLHPFPLSAEPFRADAEALAADARVVAPSLRGFGGSAPFEEEPSVDAMADDVAALLDALQLPTAVVGGVSMGGYVALAFARRHAARLRGIVLADTRAEADSPEGRGARDAAIARVEGGDLEGFVDALLEKLVSPATRVARPELVSRVREMALASPPRRSRTRCVRSVTGPTRPRSSRASRCPRWSSWAKATCSRRPRWPRRWWSACRTRRSGCSRARATSRTWRPPSPSAPPCARSSPPSEPRLG